MTKFEKWLIDNIHDMPISMRCSIVCELVSCKDCPLNVFDNCDTDNSDVAKWFSEEVVEESKTGHWIDCEEREPWYRCSECGRRVWGSANHYCPDCGIKMQAEKEE